MSEDIESNRLVCAYAAEFMRSLPDNSIHACVTDPPYGLEFMGVEWDSLGNGPTDHSPDSFLRIQRWHGKWAKQLFRVMRPGGHALVFAGTRTYHRIACGIEDAGFEIRDQIDWIYGCGFPKGLNISKAIDKRLGLTRPVIGTKRAGFHRDNIMNDDGWRGESDERVVSVTAPVSLGAQHWEGWNTLLRPTHESIALVRKPIAEKTIPANVLRWGTGALNVEACRLSPSGRWPANMTMTHHPDCKLVEYHPEKTAVKLTIRKREQCFGKHGIYGKGLRSPIEWDYKGNSEVWACVEGCPIKALNEQSGKRKAGGTVTGKEPSPIARYGIYGKGWKRQAQDSYNDVGGVARFFFCSKPSPRERTFGIEKSKRHITMKPIELTRWLVRLVTPKNGIVIDPFMGSGTTAIAAELEDVHWIGCDKSPEYVELAIARIKAWRRMAVREEKKERGKVIMRPSS